ncbi:T-lymphoma invasion and metastasis-inducing protein 1-like isoform X1 [Polyodon spathula]|uniref:T-lymphoma invasion and metastasis-inducing protein 1-like isoform X1 n=2 Tax=Polyodon spathula TaxID=7913 RepID=UPI001B7DCEB1|nr:T-lymphoma invasion and metastasis-inducing protein 1-like isoform X1 [Polyodon spathula]XP_041128033.1 T-lymphoma invasion and metastasis-inducing protein 1-like isoform X1 [Polyodon spathula]
MGNVESQNGDHAFYGDKQGQLSRKHMSRSLRISSKQSRRSRHASSGKVEHRNSETSTRSSSTPSIPQSLAENGLELFNETNVLEDFGSPIWVDRVAMNLRPVSFHTESLVDSSMDNNTVQTAASLPSMQETKDSRLFQGEVTYLQRTRNGSCGNESVNFKKKRSKSADMWREDSLEFSLSDLSQEHLTSTEEIIDTTEKDYHKCERLKANSSPKGMETLNSSHRANSFDELYGQSSPSVINGAPRNRSVKYCRNLVSHSQEVETSEETSDDKVLSPSEDDAASYGAYTLPCRRSHCLSEGASSQQVTRSNSMQGRRAKTTQDVTTWEGSEYADSGIDGATTDSDLKTRCSKAMSATYSPSTCTRSSVFIGSDSGSNVGDALLQGVYENFRRELEMSSTNTGSLEEASAVSDEQSSGTMSSPGKSDILLTAAQGTVRKAGALAVKNFLVHKKNKKVELATRRKWKRYWVSLKGCTLFFYEADGQLGIDHNSIPKHAVWVENSIVQAVPEHPKKDFVFCLSNSLGDAFLFQTCSQTELENWITAIHSACATAVARQHHKDDTVKLLKTEIKKLEQKIDMDEKMKKMGEMQLSSVKDTKKRKTILEQIFLWEQNLEQFQMDLFRFRCYLSSLQGGELPNPKRLLAFASRPTKHAMGRLGIFSVSSFHALVAARTESGVRRRTQVMSRSASKRKSRFSSLWGLDTTSKKKTKGRPSINQVFADGEDTVKKSLDGMFDPVGVSTMETEAALNTVEQHNPDSDIWVPEYLTPSWVCLPNDQPVLAIIQPEDLPMDILEMICKIHQLDPAKYYVRLKFLVENQVQFYIPKPEEHIHDMFYKEIEICPKMTSFIQFDKSDSSAIGYGFSVSVLEEDGVQRIYINDVKEGGLAFAKGLKAGDEILQLNSKDASHLNVSDMKSAFSQPSLSLAISTVPVDKKKKYCSLPPLRSDGEEQLYSDIFSRSQENILDDVGGIGLESTLDEIEVQLETSLETDDSSKSTEQVAAFCRSLHDMNPSELSSQAPDSSGPQPAILRQLTDADKLRKVICELVETERTYVKDLKCLIDRYLTPLQKETFLTQDELDVLFGNLAEMLEFQNEFLQTLEDGTRLVPDLEKLEEVDQFKKVLFSLGGSFLYYADRFKIYSAFCASHTKVPKVLVKAKTDPAFKAFLDAQNPKQQHSSTLESYLIKPIQRVLKYPLLLRELFSLTDPESEEHYHLDVAMKAMNKVASHINEMQKIHEEYGAVFDQLIAEQIGEKKEVADLSMGDLLLHTTVVWLNPPASFGKWKKDPELAAFVFKNAVVFVYKDCSKQKKKMGASHRASISDERDPFRFRHMISTDALQVRALASSDAEGGAVCEVVHVKSESEGRPERTFHLCCSSPESKKDFLKTIHSVLRDKQRRQLLKTESLPPNQQYVPFGGKRLCALKGARPVMNRAVSAPSRTLGKRKLVRNRFTIDTDSVFECNPATETQQQPQPQQAAISADTDRWVEEQFDLDQYEDQEDVKETDILSDDDEYCESVKGPTVEYDLPAQVKAVSLTDNTKPEWGNNHKTGDSRAIKTAQLKKQSAVSGLNCAIENNAEEVIWVRREDFVPVRNSDI